MDSQPNADLLIIGSWAWVGSGQLLKDVAVATAGEHILEIANAQKLRLKYPQAQVIGGENRLLVPGFISTHTHLFQTYLKGVGMELPLYEWIQKVTIPAALQMSERDAYLSAAVGIMEAIRSGTTTVMEYSYAFPDPEIFDAIIQAFADFGIRGWLGVGVNDTGAADGGHKAFIQPLEKCLLRLNALKTKLDHPPGKHIKLAISPSSIRGLSSNALQELRDYAEEHDIVFSLHTNETNRDNEVALKRFGRRTIPTLAEFGVLSPRFLAVHCVQMSEEDIHLIAQHGAHVSHNPVSNMYLGVGIAPVKQMMEGGINISLGVDGAASNNSQDMLENIKVTALAQRAAARHPGAIKATDALKMATCGGAKSLDMEGQLGELTAGSLADITVLNFNTPKSLPVHDPVANLVFSASEENVETVIVAGKIILDDGKFINVNEKALLMEAQQAASRLVHKAAIF